MRRLPAFDDPSARQTLEELCVRHGVTAALVRQMAEILARHSGRAYKAGISAEIDTVVNEYLREVDGDE